MSSVLLRLAALVALALCAACGVATRTETIGPGYDGTLTIRTRGNLLPTPVAGLGPVELNLEKVERRERPPEFALLVEVHAEGLRLRPRESLAVVVDGEPAVWLQRDSATLSWPRLDPTIREQARYVVSDSLLLRLGGAAQATVRLRGAAWTETRRLSAANLEAVRRFVAEQVDSATVD